MKRRILSILLLCGRDIALAGAMMQDAKDPPLYKYNYYILHYTNNAVNCIKIPTFNMQYYPS